jgi:hypothetical protein
MTTCSLPLLSVYSHNVLLKDMQHNSWVGHFKNVNGECLQMSYIMLIICAKVDQ